MGEVRQVTADQALPGRNACMPLPPGHLVSGRPLDMAAGPAGQEALFAMGCFWGAERRFWQQPGVLVTAVGYAGGYTPNPTYEEVCSGLTGHTETVRVVFDPAQVSYGELLRLFWEGHDPTQGMRQGNDIGTQYRSAVYTFGEIQQRLLAASLVAMRQALAAAGLGAITTETAEAPPFYFAEPYHQQYLARNPHGYCGLGGLGVVLPAAWEAAAN